MQTALSVLAVLAFATFWLVLGTFLGVRLGERRLMKRIRETPPSPSASAYLGNTVARSAGRPEE